MTLYNGRIQTKPEMLMDLINRSLPTDIRLLPYDLQNNRAWAGQLRRLGLFTQDEHEKILAALDEIEAMAEQGAFDPLPDDEDVHTLVERLLALKAGGAGKNNHAGRSRNDQVVCDLRMAARDLLSELMEALVGMIRNLAAMGRKHANTVLAGTTHMQPAQPITLGHFLLSAAFALLRDLQRATDARTRTNQCPLGSGALAGSGFAVDREALADALGFEGVCGNALDAVSDRDFVQEIAGVCSILCGHLSRYAEQLIIWSNPNFGYVRFADEFSTGSSMMPQKRNPDAMELIRAKAARCIGNAACLAALTKGLPLSYAKDLQEDKQALFDSLDIALLCVRVFDRALGSARFDPERMARALSGDMLATELADALAPAGVPFRQAHERVARWVTELEEKGMDLLDSTPEEMASKFPELGDAPALSFDRAVARRCVIGGTAPDAVRNQARAIEKALEDFETDPNSGSG